MRARVFLFRGMQGNSAPPLGAPSLANGAPGSASHRGAPEAGPGTESAPSLTLTPHPPWRRTERRAASASKEFPFKEEGEMFSFSSSLQDKPTIQAVLCQTNKRRRAQHGDDQGRRQHLLGRCSQSRGWRSSSRDPKSSITPAWHSRALRLLLS